MAAVGLGVVALAACQPGAAATPDAATSQVTASHTGHSSAELADPAGLRWAASLPGYRVHSVATSGERVFAAVGAYGPGGPDHGSQVVALRRSDGGVLWSGGASTEFQRWVAAADGAVYTVDREGTLERLDPVTGARRWIVDIRGTVGSAPVPYGDQVFVTSWVTGGVVTAIDAQTGRTDWSVDATGVGNLAPPSVRDDGVYASGACGNTAKLRRSDGRLLWNHDAGCSGDADLPPVVAGNRVWWGGGGSGPKPILDATTGEQTGWWTAGSRCAPIVTDSEVITTGTSLTAKDPVDDRVRWTRTIEGEHIVTCPVSAGRRLAFLNSAGRWVTIDRATGKTVRRQQLPVDPTGVQLSPLTQSNVGGGLALIPFGDRLLAIG